MARGRGLKKMARGIVSKAKGSTRKIKNGAQKAAAATKNVAKKAGAAGKVVRNVVEKNVPAVNRVRNVVLTAKDIAKGKKLPEAARNTLGRTIVGQRVKKGHKDATTLTRLLKAGAKGNVNEARTEFGKLSAIQRRKQMAAAHNKRTALLNDLKKNPEKVLTDSKKRRGHLRTLVNRAKQGS